MRYAIVIEKAEGNYSAYVPDLPGCVATGPTVEAVEGTSATPSAFTSPGCGKTACRYRLQRASRITSRPEPWRQASPAAGKRPISGLSAHRTRTAAHERPPRQSARLKPRPVVSRRQGHHALP